MSSRGGGGGSGKKEFPPANSSYRDVSTSMVIQTDRSEIIRRDKEAGSDAVESLWGRVNVSEMGSRAGREAVPQSGGSVLGLAGGRKKKASAYNEIGVRGDDDEVELKYRPRTKETRTAYEHILTFLQQAADFSDQPASILRSATEEVLIILKSTEESWKDLDRKLKIESVLGIKSGEMASDKYSQLVNLGRRITDFSIENGEETNDKFDESQGVAVVFDDEEDGEEGGAGDFGAISNLLEENTNEEGEGEEEEEGYAEAEEELEKSLPAIARMSQRTIGKPEEKLLDFETLAFPEGIVLACFILIILTDCICVFRWPYDDQ